MISVDDGNQIQGGKETEVKSLYLSGGNGHIYKLP